MAVAAMPRMAWLLPTITAFVLVHAIADAAVVQDGVAAAHASAVWYLLGEAHAWRGRVAKGLMRRQGGQP